MKRERQEKHACFCLSIRLEICPSRQIRCLRKLAARCWSRSRKPHQNPINTHGFSITEEVAPDSHFLIAMRWVGYLLLIDLVRFLRFLLKPKMASYANRIGFPKNIPLKTRPMHRHKPCSISNHSDITAKKLIKL